MTTTAGFTQEFRVRFDECDADGRVRPSALLRYVIETAFGHSAALGYQLSWYEQQGLYWLVRHCVLNVQTGLGYGTEVAVTTEVVGFRRIWARRRNVVRAGGMVAAVAVMDWIFTQADGSPARIPRAMEEAFPGLGERLEASHLTVESPPADAIALPYPVPAHQIDPRRHMNTAAYLDLLDDTFETYRHAGASRGDGASSPNVDTVRYEMEFLRPAARGQVLYCACWRTHDRWQLVASLDNSPSFRGSRSAGAQVATVAPSRPKDVE